MLTFQNVNPLNFQHPSPSTSLFCSKPCPGEHPSSLPAVKTLRWLVLICPCRLRCHRPLTLPSWMFPEHPSLHHSRTPLLRLPPPLGASPSHLDHIMHTCASFESQLKCHFLFEDPRPPPSSVFLIHFSAVALTCPLMSTSSLQAVNPLRAVGFPMDPQHPAPVLEC